jgi:hypothetical protein
MNKNQTETIGLNIERLTGIEDELKATDWSGTSPEFNVDLKMALQRIKEAKAMLLMSGNRLIKE